MIGQKHSLGEHEAFRINSPRRRLFPQISGGACVVFEQPQYAAVDLLEYPHPAVKHVGSDLVIIIEATKNKAFLRQPNFRSGERFVRDATFAIIKLDSCSVNRQFFQRSIFDWTPVSRSDPQLDSLCNQPPWCPDSLNN